MSMDKMKEHSSLISFTVAVNADWLETLRKIDKSVERIKSFRMIGDGRLHVSCYTEPNKLMTSLQKEGKRARLVHWQYGEAPTTINFTLNVRDHDLLRKLLKIVLQDPLRKTFGAQIKDDETWDASGCIEPNTLMNYLVEAGNMAHLVHWKECATNLCQNCYYHQVGLSDYNPQPRTTCVPSYPPRGNYVMKYSVVVFLVFLVLFVFCYDM